jgi:hypothetical protein
MNYRVERFCDPDTGECTYYLSSTAAYDYATVKYAPDGTQLWAANYDGRGNDFPRAMALDAAGNVYVTGVAADAFGQYGDYATVKYSATGRRLWVARYPHDPSPYCASEGNDPRAIAVDAAGNVYVVGSGCKSIPLPNGTVVIVTVHPIVKYDPDGNQLWEISQHNPGENFRPAFLAADVAGNLHVAGSGTSLLKKYDPNGNVLWRVPNSVDVDVSRITALALDAAGNVYLSGQGWLGTGGNQDYVTQKYDAQGTLLWFAGFGGLGNDSPSALAVDDAGNVVVTGTAHRADGGYDMATVKYVPNLDPPQPPRLDSLAVASYSNAIQVITFTLMGEVGRRYTIQGSEDLANWTALKSFFSATGTNQVTDIPTPNTRRRFYRAVTP